jgi:hypothetical protein
MWGINTIRGAMIASVLYGLLFMYCVHGAIKGDIFLPGKHPALGLSGIHVSGIAAWALVVSSGALLISAPLSMWRLRRYEIGVLSKAIKALQWTAGLSLLAALFLNAH